MFKDDKEKNQVGKKERLAKALRENLRKRKIQQREKEDQKDRNSTKEETTDSSTT